MNGKASFLDREHTEILESLQHAAMSGGGLGILFSEILSVFSYHLDREEETVLPLLNYLPGRTSRAARVDLVPIHLRASEFCTEIDSMLKEHQKLSELSSSASTFSGSGNENVSCLIKKLKHHMLLEEEILYPAAMGVLKLLEFESHSGFYNNSIC